MGCRHMKKKRIFSAIWTVFTIILFLFATLFLMLLIMSSGSEKPGGKGLFGYKSLAVPSDSMSQHFKAGDLIIIKDIEPDAVKVGNIISFKSADPELFNQIVTRKVREIIEYDGKPAFTTYSTTSSINDPYPALYDSIVGKYSFKMPGLGRALNKLKTPWGYILFILIPFSAVILIQIIRFVLVFRRVRRERPARAQNPRGRRSGRESKYDAENALRKERMNNLFAELNEMSKMLDSMESEQRGESYTKE